MSNGTQQEKSVPVKLFTDDSHESEEARRILREAEVSVQEFKAGRDYNPGPDFFKPPTILHAGNEYEGLEDIKAFVSIYSHPMLARNGRVKIKTVG